MDSLPAPSPDQNFVTVHALSSGSLTLPEHLFVHPCPPGARKTVPSLSFLIRHQPTSTNLIFDLGLRRDRTQYPAPIQKHLLTREPLSTEPDVKASIENGGLSLEEIDFVIISHLHWDHIGTPSDFTKSTFIVGPGSLDLLRHGGDVSTTGSHSHFETDLLPTERTIELPLPGQQSSQNTKIELPGITTPQWKPIANFPHAIDVFEDASLFIVNAPGHLQGHINLLARTGPENWVYLAGDACHDRRLLRGELDIAEWEKDGKVCCIHVDKAKTEETLGRIRGLERGGGVEVILAHDREWIDERGNEERFWPGKL